MKKSNWVQLTTLCFILSVTAACGGKNSSGGSGGKDPQYNLLKPVSNNSEVLPSSLRNTYQAEQIVSAFNQALTWRNNNSENGEVLSAGFTRGQINEQSGNANGNCSTGTFLKFFEYQYCKNGSNYSNSSVTFAKTPTQFCTIKEDNNKLRVASVSSNTIPYSGWGCNLSNLSDYSKDKNSELNKVLSLNNGTWHLYGAETSGSTVYLLVGDKNVGPSLMYGIDTRYHSVYNPVSIQHLSTGATTKSLILQ